MKKTGPRVKKNFLSSTDFSMKYVLDINFKMPTIGGILKFITRKKDIFCYPEQEYRHIKFFIFMKIANFMLM